MSGGGGGYDTGPDWDMKLAQWEFQWKDIQEKAIYNEEGFAIAQRNQKNQTDWQNQTALNQWEDKEKMRIFDFNNQVEAFNASVEAYGEQLDYNNLAAEMATADNTRHYNNQLTQIGFQNEDLLMKLDFAEDQAGLKQRGVTLDVKDAVAESGLQAREMTLALQGRRAEVASKSQELRLQGLQKEGKLAAMGQTGRSARKNLQSIIANQGVTQRALVDLITREESSYNLNLDKVAQKLQSTTKRANLSYDQISSEIMNTRKQTEFGQRQLQESMKGATEEYKSNQQHVQLDKYAKDLAAKDRLAPTPIEQPQLSRPLAIPEVEMQAPQDPISRERWEEVKPIEGAATAGTPGWMQAMSVAGTAIGIAAGIKALSATSDDRLKYDITRVGTSPSGIPKYTFRYRADGKHGPKYIGTSAQDLISIGRKDAVGQKEKDGFYYVDYSKLDVDMEVVTT